MNVVSPSKLTTSQEAVLQKYLVGSEQTWEAVSRRVCKFVSKAEKTPQLQKEWEEKFYSIIQPMKFMPGGSILANSDHGTKGLLNCWVLSAEDNLESITKLVSDSIMTTRFRGGIGVHIGAEGEKGYIRPVGASFSDGAALGPCAVLDMVSENVRKLTTGNKARRGALLFSISWRHPDVFAFIAAKTQSVIDAEVAQEMAEAISMLLQVDSGNWRADLKRAEARQGEVLEQFHKAWVETHLSPEGKRDRRWHNANISVQLDDEFFELLDEANSLERSDPDISLEEIHRFGVLEYQHADKLLWVKTLWNQIAQYAHATADPGLLLIDNAKRRSPLREYVTTTNPCGEIYLPPNSACNLGSIVVTKFVSKNTSVHDPEIIEIDWTGLAETVEIAVRFLDNVLDVSEFATPDQKYNVQNVYRQLGLGIMGWADYLKMARIPYDSEGHIVEIDKWGSFIADQAYRASEELATEKSECGVWEEIADVRTNNRFEHWNTSVPGLFASSAQTSDLLQPVQVPRRNSTVLSIAPTGSIAALAGCSWAIEPDFGLTTWKQTFVDASKSQQQWVQIPSLYLDELTLSEADLVVVKQTGSLQDTGFAGQHPETAAAFKIAREIAPEAHVRVQACWQKWVDSSISKTINLPKETTVEEIKAVYRLAHSLKAKGITVYRQGTLESEPIKVGDQEMEKPRECRSGECSV